MRHFLFGFGSIINDESRLLTKGECKSLNHEAKCGCSFSGGFYDNAVGARLFLPGYVRSWCFRSCSGFTALGVTSSDSHVHTIFGVLFEVTEKEIASFDDREVDYNRITISANCIKIDDSVGCIVSRIRAKQLRDEMLSDQCSFWLYIPKTSATFAPSPDYPILTTYLDVCLLGCLQWGGEALAEEFLLNTTGWSKYYLNDAPLSRRPWLYRKNYQTIDRILEKHGELVMFSERLHSEEYAVSHLALLRGVWGVPARNPKFVGRDNDLLRLESLLAHSDCDVEQLSPSISQLIGQAGVGKSTLAAEFAWRHSMPERPSMQYGLVVWLRAESLTSMMEDVRKFAHDMGIAGHSSKVEGMNSDDAVVVHEFHRRLGQCKCRWLLIFDNVEDAQVLEQFYPRVLAHGSSEISRSEQFALNGVGAGSSSVPFGSVIITSRRDLSKELHAVLRVPKECIHALEMHCFHRQDSVKYLSLLLRTPVSSVLEALGERLGDLPLALSIAAAYIQQCNVSVAEYLLRLDAILTSETKFLLSEQQSDMGDRTLSYQSIVSSVAVSLNHIRSLSPRTALVIGALSYCCTEPISKSLVEKLLDTLEQRLLSANNSQPIIAQSSSEGSLLSLHDAVAISMGTMFVAGSLHLVASALVARNSDDDTGFVAALIAAVISGVSSLCAILLFTHLQADSMKATAVETQRASEKGGHSSLLEADRIWSTMRSYSFLITAPVGQDEEMSDKLCASMHRLQQAVIRQLMLAEATNHLTLAVETVFGSWNYRINDLCSWETSGELLPHVDTLTQFAQMHWESLSARCLQQCISLLVDAACYSSTAGSRFQLARTLVYRAAKLFHCFLQKKSAAMETASLQSSALRYRILHTAGKIYRYLGNLPLSVRALVCAAQLELQVIQSGDFCGETTECSVSDIIVVSLSFTTDSIHATSSSALAITYLSWTIHELGIALSRQKQLSQAEEALRAVLHLKRLLRTSPQSVSVCTDDDIASTLHQRGIVFIHLRKYQEAEENLLNALRYEFQWSDMSGNTIADAVTRVAGDQPFATANAVAKAATLQQLARVCSRKGQFDQAQALLRCAWSLLQKAYGGCDGEVAHINLAAVHHHLGVVHSEKHQYHDALTHFETSIKIRVSVLQMNTYAMHSAQVCGTNVNAAIELMQEVRLFYLARRKAQKQEVCADDSAPLLALRVVLEMKNSVNRTAQSLDTDDEAFLPWLTPREAPNAPRSRDEEALFARLKQLLKEMCGLQELQEHPSILAEMQSLWPREMSGESVRTADGNTAVVPEECLALLRFRQELRALARSLPRLGEEGAVAAWTALEQEWWVRGEEVVREVLRRIRIAREEREATTQHVAKAVYRETDDLRQILMTRFPGQRIEDR